MTIFTYQTITFFTIILLSLNHINNAQEVAQLCYDHYGNYSISSNYGINVNKSIIQLATLSSKSYFNTVTIGNGTDKVTALSSCRYDMTSDLCKKCIQRTLKDLPRCGRNMKSIYFHQECTVRFSNSTDFFQGGFNWWYIYGFRNVSKGFSTLLSKTIKTLVSNAVSEFNVSSRYFATTTANYSASESIYALAQCNQDLTSSSCNDCLGNSFGNFSSEYPTAFLGQVFMPDCLVSYKLSNVSMSRPYNFTIEMESDGDYLTPTPSPSPPNDDGFTPLPPKSGSTGTRGMSTMTMSSFIIVLLSFGLLI